MVGLGAASNFAILAGSGISVAGAGKATTINGAIGTYPTPAITGLSNALLNGANHTAKSSHMLKAMNAAFINAAARPATLSFGPIYDLGGSTLMSGVYSGPTSFGLTGSLALDAKNNPEAVWIFQAGSTLTTASSSQVVLKNGAQACHGFWVVGSSANLGVGNDFIGNIPAKTSIMLNTSVAVNERALAANGANTLNSNLITGAIRDNTGVSRVPDGGSTLLLLGCGVTGLLALGRKFSFLTNGALAPSPI